MSHTATQSTLGRGSSQPIPWMTFALVAISVVTYSLVAYASRRADAESEEALQGAVAYLIEHPYLEPGPVLGERVEPSLLEQRVRTLENARVARGGLPLARRAQQKQQADLDGLVAGALTGVSKRPPQRFGVNAADLAPLTLLTHAFLHESGAHLMCALALVLLLGFQLESVWGSRVFAGFFVAASVVSGATFAFGNPGFSAPLIGMSGAVAAMLAAFALSARSIWHHPVYLFSLILGALFLILPPRFGLEWSLSPGIETAAVLAGHRGAPYWAAAGGFAFGLAGQLLISLVRGARGGEAARRSGGSTRVSHPKLERIIDARAAGRTTEAAALLSQLLRDHPDDHEAWLVKWDIALDLGHPTEAAEAMLRVLRDEVRRGDEIAAIEHWLELSGRALHADAESALLIRLALMLEKHEHSHAAVAALQQALAKTVDADAAVVATRVARASRDLDAETARAAAWRALGSVELALEERQSLEALLAEIGSGIEPRQTAATQPGLEIDLEPVARPPEPRRRPAPPVRAPAAPEAWVDPALAADASESPGDAAENLVMADLVHVSEPASESAPQRPEPIALGSSLRRIRVLPARPLALAPDGLRIEAEQGVKKRLPLERLEAISVAAIGGLSQKPVLVIDLVMNWTSGGDEPLKVVRMRGDRFDARPFGAATSSPLEALRHFVEVLLTESGAVPLPDPQAARGLPFASFPDAAAYQQSVLGAGEDEPD